MNAQTQPSPFHRGEREAQTRVGKRDAIEAIGRRIIRPYMPDQHREFFAQLPFMVMGSVDADGWPWASIVAGGAGFVTSPSDTELNLDVRPLADDPLAAALGKDAPVGLLGIEVPTRRRNRINASVVRADADGIALQVVQSFGNCPQYIQTRALDFIRPADAHVSRAPSEHFTTLDSAATAMITQADTFFVASYVNPEGNPFAEGVDVSHRGGRPGFVKVAGDTLTIPDFSGNNAFNTIGNFLVNPKAGLIFADFATGDVVMLTGTVEMLWEDHPDVLDFQGAERAWRFTLDHGVRIYDALPFRADFEAFSPNSLMTDDWATATARKDSEAQRSAWREMRVSALQDESSVIRSFTLVPVDDLPLLAFEAGQFLTLEVSPDGQALTRTYTVSSAPGEDAYRISVKREADGVVSRYLHDHVQVGDVIRIKAPKGAFYLDALEKRPAVLLAGGVGITPMLAMTRHVLRESVRKRFTRPLTVFHAAQTVAQRAFAQEFRAAQAATDGAIRYVSLISQPEKGDDFDVAGYITADLLRDTLGLDDYDFYLCGPPAFMQAVYDMLRDLGAADARIFAESFGPASLTRRVDAGAPIVAEAEAAVVQFAASGFEQPWTKGDGTLLETAEAHGLTPAFSCRSGSCGSCATKKLAGNVTYRSPVSAEHAADEVLICCAVPAADTEELILDL